MQASYSNEKFKLDLSIFIKSGEVVGCILEHRGEMNPVVDRHIKNAIENRNVYHENDMLIFQCDNCLYPLLGSSEVLRKLHYLFGEADLMVSCPSPKSISVHFNGRDYDRQELHGASASEYTFNLVRRMNQKN